MRQWIVSALVQIMVCLLFVTKPLSKKNNAGLFLINQNTKISINENASENIVCEMAAILCRGRWVNNESAALCTKPSTQSKAKPSVGYTDQTLTHWGWVTHICASKLTTIGSDNGFLPGWHQAAIWSNAGILLISPLGTIFSEICIKIHTFSFKKMHLQMSAKWRPFCLGLNELNQQNIPHTLSSWERYDASVFGEYYGRNAHAIMRFNYICPNLQRICGVCSAYFSGHENHVKILPVVLASLLSERGTSIHLIC